MRSTLLALAIALLALPGLFAASTAESAAVEDTAAQMTDGFAVYATQADYEQATGNTITTYGEAPMLAALVAAGELPPVQERLPEEPLVVQPLASIGRYGGNLIGAANYPTYGADDVWSARIQGLLKPSMDLSTVVANAAKAWQASDDLRSLTLHLRRGMKWSDGHPFTADDITFWYEDYLGNDEINPVKPKMWSPGGELMKVEKLDDLTVRYCFAAPFPGGTVLMAAVPRDGNWTTSPRATTWSSTTFPTTPRPTIWPRRPATTTGTSCCARTGAWRFSRAKTSTCRASIPGCWTRSTRPATSTSPAIPTTGRSTPPATSFPTSTSRRGSCRQHGDRSTCR